MMKLLSLLTAVFLLFVSCGKDPSGIPDVPLNFHASIDLPSMRTLSTVGGYVEIQGYGVAGLIIYNSPFDGYVAYDRCSPVNPEQKCAVKVDDTGLTATDPCSKAIFSLMDGTPQDKISKKPLKRYYNISFNRTSREIFVSN